MTFESRFPQRSPEWRLRRRTLAFSRRPALMGIVNVTPDSFSDGGSFLAPQAAIDHALQLVQDGAEILDIGGESTRPYSAPVSTAEELRRIAPVVAAVCEQTDVPVSIDTSKAAVAEEALQAGAEIVNDVTGLEGDPNMLDVVLKYHPGVCAMHMRGTPQTMQDDPAYENVVEEIGDYLRRRRELLQEAGLDPLRVCLDPGIGFGKTHQHNLILLSRCGEYHALQRPLLVGHSRKGFIAHVLGDKEADRTAGVLGVSVQLALQGIQVLRVHDVRQVRDALLLFEAAGGLGATVG